jgi:signal transduction histidine kinase
MRGRGLVLFFILSLLLPGAALALFGVRALLQERQVVDHELRARAERAVATAILQIEREFGSWERAIPDVGDTEPDRGILPAITRGAFLAAGDAVVLRQSEDRTVWWPRASVLYSIDSGESAPGPPSRELLAVEALEADGVEASIIVGRYRALLGRHPADTPRILHRLARVYRKTQQLQEAREALNLLRKSTGTLGVVPAALIANYELCSLATAVDDLGALGECARSLYQRLVDGEWMLTNERYSYYASTAVQWLEKARVGGADLDSLRARERAKRGLTNAIESVRAAGCVSRQAGGAAPILVDADVVAVITCDDASRLTRAVAYSQSWARAHLWPELLRATGADGYHVAVQTRAGELLFSSTVSQASTPAANFVVERTADIAGGVRVRVWPRDPTAYSATLWSRQRVYLLTLALVIGSLLFGTYVTTGVVRRELQVAQLKSEFVSTVSHEFRSPLTAIRQVGEMLARNRVPELRRAEYYDRITREAERLSRLVENLLDFAQIESGRKHYQLEPLATSAWLRSIAGEFRNIRESQGLRLEALIPDDLPSVCADAAALGSAIHNLLDNAVKYSPGEDTVWLEAEASTSSVIIRVRDRGVGIAREERRRIFEKFYRTRGEITREVKGAGLGLSLVQRIVATHRGRIDCDSVPGVGTTFSVHLPAHPSLS